ncbi:MAG: discoidin domain-containing protein, partial [Candidatus Latescibacteria bacterium]|nr:discoidin domain-containing protein [Candidatus Latescibacterota bacterium]
MRRRVTATVFVCFALAGSYISLWAEEVMFDTKEDWSAWKAAKGTVEITEDGWVTPAFVRKDINASLNAREFGGGVKAGSAPDKAEETVDGDMTTWWSPRSEDPPEDWWIEVDLGRVITATRMVLKFAEQYSPFEQFEVYVSAGNEAFFAGSKLKDYRLVFRTTRPNDQ